MKNILNFLIIAMLLLATPAFGTDNNADDDDVKLFAVATVSNSGKDLIEGDSVLVTLTLYSNLSLTKVENLDKNVPEIKDASVRAYGANRRLTQQISAYEGKRYYSVVAEQFVVASRSDGTLVFPQRRYNVGLEEVVRNRRYSPFDDFFGFDSPFDRQGKTYSKKCTSESLKIKVVKRPPKTMHELQRGGAVLM